MYTPIQLDKVRNFRYGMKALKRIEKMTGKPIMKLDMDNLSIEELSVMLWAGLVHEDESLTPDSVIDLIDDHSNMTDAAEVMGEAFSRAFDGGKEGKKEIPATQTETAATST